MALKETVLESIWYQRSSIMSHLLDLQHHNLLMNIFRQKRGKKTAMAFMRTPKGNINVQFLGQEDQEASFWVHEQGRDIIPFPVH